LRVFHGQGLVADGALGADGDAVATGDAVLICAGAKSGKPLAIRLKKPLRAYFAAHTVTQAGVVINCYQTHAFLLFEVVEKQPQAFVLERPFMRRSAATPPQGLLRVRRSDYF
jgi:hypothetical protein